LPKKAAEETVLHAPPPVRVPVPLDDDALDQLFRSARTFSHWLDKPVTEATLRAVVDLAKMGPTSANSSPARFVFVVSPEAKERLRPHLSRGNVRQTMSAPATAIVGYDSQFYEALGFLYPHQPGARGWFTDKPETVAQTALRNASLQGAYLILAARALGLDCGPMSGFDAHGVAADFFPGERIRANFLINLGYGDRERLHPRSPRFSFDEFCAIV
jgi:3-hydroxypropanoate dehydrogenase